MNDRDMYEMMRNTAPPLPTRIEPQRVRLTPIPWGRPDRALARGVCEHMRRATPPLELPFNPRTDRKVRETLRRMGVAV